MGINQEKYTKEYFTGLDNEGNPVDYGATLEVDENGIYKLRTHDRIILDAIDFKDKKVLDIGFGRGEAICFALSNGAAECIGVDFSRSAVDLAHQLIAQRNLPQAELFNMDALIFVDYYAELSSNNNLGKFDIVIMFDIIEHIPHAELRMVLEGITKITNSNAIFIINTPAYKFDNDVIIDGFDERNLIDCFDTSDIVPETRGMHCNKYSVISLQEFMFDCGFINLTEAHYYIKYFSSSRRINNIENISYFERWLHAQKLNVPIKNNYKDDLIEFPYKVEDPPSLVKFTQGNMNGLSLLITKTYQEIAFLNGNYDEEMYGALNKNEIDKSVVFDVGSFIGVSSLLFSKFGEKCKVITFEPNLWNRNRMLVNLSHNQNFAKRIKVFNYALGDSNKNISMKISADVDGGYSSTSRIISSHPKIKNDSLPEAFFDTDVEIRTLDWFVENYRIAPNVLKIDVEGAEHIVLSGAISTLRQHKPILFIELHSEYCSLICSQILENLGYRIHVIKEEPDNRILVKAVFNSVTKDDDYIDKYIHSFSRQNDLILQLGKMYEMVVKELDDEIKNTRNLHDSLQIEHQVLQGKYQPLLNDHQGLLNIYQILQDDHQGLLNIYQVLQDDHQGLLNKYQILQDDHQGLLNKYQILQDDHQGLLNKYQALLNDHQGLLDKYQVLQDDHQGLLNKYQNFQENQLLLQDQLYALENELIALKNEHQSLLLSKSVRYSNKIKKLLRKLGLGNNFQ